MEEKKLFKIGEVAGIYHISMGTLRHYEREGLLEPEMVDPQTGYRYYSAKQFEVLNTIRYLRVLDMPLSQIADFLKNRDVDVIKEKLIQQKKLIRQKQQELEQISRKIDHRLEYLQDAVNSRLDEIMEKEIPAGRIVWMRDNLQPRSYLDLESSIRRLQKDQKEPLAFLGKVGVGISQENLAACQFDQYDLVFLLLDEEDDYDGKIETYPDRRCVTVRFRGSHSEAAGYYKMLMEYIHEHQKKIIGFSREITLIDNGLTSDPDKFVTEIQIPVAE